MKSYYTDYIKGLEWHIDRIKDIHKYKSIYLTGSFSRDEQKIGASDIDLDFIYPCYSHDIWEHTLDLCGIWKEGGHFFKREGDKGLISFPKISSEEDLVSLVQADPIRWMRKSKYAKLLHGQESYPAVQPNLANMNKDLTRLAVRELINMYYLLNVQYRFGEWNRGQWQRSLSEFFRCLIGMKTEIIVHRYEDICQWSSYLFGQKDLASEHMRIGNIAQDKSGYIYGTNKINEWSKLLFENMRIDHRELRQIAVDKKKGCCVENISDDAISANGIWKAEEWWYQRHFKPYPNCTKIYVSLDDDLFYNCNPIHLLTTMNKNNHHFGNNYVAVFLPKSLFEMYTIFVEPRLGIEILGSYDDYSMDCNCKHDIAIYFFSMIGNYGEVYNSADIRKKIKKWMSKTESVLSSLSYLLNGDILQTRNETWKKWSQYGFETESNLINDCATENELRDYWKKKYPDWCNELQTIKKSSSAGVR
ncbi:nucleotidyltransferase domain-containing protein [Paenibacillus alkalitolerans]|uniref:nucleotidyltransferase domain-containing protein n=1 Tax=Paenibacillus alkalitolerans TaxID=2799335 RepID=UPI0018F5B55B|nr:nucleotidyltransferase domain-containing protein [Paenibacillus alkalitolerans]